MVWVFLKSILGMGGRAVLGFDSQLSVELTGHRKVSDTSPISSNMPHKRGRGGERERIFLIGDKVETKVEGLKTSSPQIRNFWAGIGSAEFEIQRNIK